MSRLLLLVALLGLPAFSLRPDVTAPKRTAPVNKPKAVSDFTLRDARGKTHSLSDCADRRLVVVAFLRTGCPLAQIYGPRLAELARIYEARGVAFLGVDANGQDSLADLAAYARAHKLPFPLLKDPDAGVADEFGAERTPEVFVFDAQRVVRYRGRIDDQHEIGVRRAEPSSRDLANALDELLAGKTVSRPTTKTVGCLIGRPSKQTPRGDVTYARHVSRIVQNRCVECHRPGQAAPFALTTYGEVRGWSAMIREVVAEGRMPPWYADPRHGRFLNDARLTTEEKDLLCRWIDEGCPEGNSADLPGTPRFAEGWRIPQPDLILHMAEQPYRVPAEGDVEYQYFEVDSGFTEDRYLRAVEVRPGNAAVVHHALVFVLKPGERLGPDNTGALIDYAPGMQPTTLPDGMAIRVPAGARFLFQVHYTPNGTAQEDRSYLGMVFADPKQVKKCVRGGAVVSIAIDIPPGVNDHRITAEQTLSENVLLLSLSPHLHLRGKSFRFTAVYPNGQSEILLDVPRYDFNWQLRYDLAEAKRLPRGTKLVCSASWDNSADNPANPDAKARVTWGDQTGDEMLIGFYVVTAGE